MSVRSYQPDELHNKFSEYLKSTTDFPSLVSFCVYADLPRSCFYNYKSINDYSDTIQKIEDQLEIIMTNTMMTAKNPAGVIFYSKNKFSWADKTEIKAVSDNPQTLDSIDVDAILLEAKESRKKQKLLNN